MRVSFCMHAAITFHSAFERLRTWTRNSLESARRGSNPLGVACAALPASTPEKATQQLKLQTRWWGTWCSGIAPARMREPVNLKVKSAGFPAGVLIACHKCFGGRRCEPALETNQQMTSRNLLFWLGGFAGTGVRSAAQGVRANDTLAEWLRRRPAWGLPAWVRIPQVSVCMYAHADICVLERSGCSGNWTR